MKNFMNGKDTYVDESLSGILRVHSDKLKAVSGNIRAIYSPASDKNRVAIVTGGGYGHLPLFLGYVGKGLCDGCAVGNVFSPPSFNTVWDVTCQVSGEKGVLFLFGNYHGDNISFMLAKEMAELEGIPCRTIRVCDDISSSDTKSKRRGIAGMFFAYKIAGASAQRGDDLERVEYITNKAVSHTATFGVATSSCRLPSSPLPIFEIHEGEVAVGMGIHGEPGFHKTTLRTSHELVNVIISDLIKDQNISEGDRVAILVNGLGGTVSEDLYIVCNDAINNLEARGVVVKKSYVGEFATSMDTAGVSITLFKLDDELESYLYDYAESAFLPL